MRTKMTALVWILTACLLSACGGGGEAQDAYGVWTEHTVFTYAVGQSSGVSVEIPAKIVDRKTIGDVSYDDYFIGENIVGRTVGGNAYVRQVDATHFHFAGGAIYSFKSSPDVPYISGETTTPIILDTAPKVGEDQNVTVTGTMTAPGYTEPGAVSISGTYKLVADDETVQTAIGPIGGCRHFTGQATVLVAATQAPLLDNATVTGELWYHDAYGIIAAKVPAYNLDTTFAGSQDLGDPNATSGPAVIRKMGVVSTSNPSFTLDTYDRKQQFDADKFSHAKMLVEMRWLDDAQAKTERQPQPGLSFICEAGMGYFGHTVVRSPLSVFHPEENGKGYVYWVAYVSEAQKNVPGTGGSDYGVQIRSADPNGAVRVTARVAYNLVDPATGE